MLYFQLCSSGVTVVVQSTIRKRSFYGEPSPARPSGQNLTTFSGDPDEEHLYHKLYNPFLNKKTQDN